MDRPLSSIRTPADLQRSVSTLQELDDFFTDGVDARMAAGPDVSAEPGFDVPAVGGVPAAERPSDRSLHLRRCG
jgi:hypothetical protein